MLVPVSADPAPFVARPLLQDVLVVFVNADKEMHVLPEQPLQHVYMPKVKLLIRASLSMYYTRHAR